MKKIVCFIIVLMLFTCSLPVFATEKNELPEFLQGIENVTEVEYHKDGSITVTTLEVLAETRATKTGKKTKNHYNPSGSLAFSVTNTSTFTYTGSSVTCSSVTASKSISDSSWTVTTGTMNSGNSSHVRYTGNQYQGSTLLNSTSGYVSLTCSSSGVIS